jgi:hypothetical protein
MVGGGDREVGGSGSSGILWGGTGSTSQDRLCLPDSIDREDRSKEVSVGAPQRGAKYDTLKKIAGLARQGWWAVTFDLEDAYHVLGIHPESRRWLGFRFQGKFYRFVLPFGLKHAPWFFTKLMKAVVTYWRGMGVFVIIYLDDICVLAPTREETLRVRDTIIEPTLQRFGLKRNITKGEWNPVQTVILLGSRVNLREGIISVPEEKLRVLECQIDDI